MMTSAVQCIIILACTAILTSSGAIIKCRCLNRGTGVRVPLKDIASATEYPPRSYCNKKEVIITLKNTRTVCLDPTEKYTKAVIQKLNAAKNTTASKATTATAPETATASETATVSSMVSIVASS